jgi:hypothetical protein
VKDFADIPAHALFRNGFAAAKPIEYFQRALGITNRPRTHADRIVVIQHEHRDIPLSQVDCSREADGTSPDDHYTAMGRRSVQLGRTPIFVNGIGVSLQRRVFNFGSSGNTFQPSSASHISLSRCAVQMRGSL